MKKININNHAVDILVSKLEEASRATRGSENKFIEPNSGTLVKAKNTRTHIIFGRRGSGKSSLINKICKELSLNRTPNVFICLETFKGHTYPDVLISVLIQILEDFKSWLEREGTSSPLSAIWLKIFGAKPTAPSINKTKAKELIAEIAIELVELKKQLYMQNDLDVKESASSLHKKSGKAKLDIDAKVIKGLGIAGSGEASMEDEGRALREVMYKHKKTEYLFQHIMNYQGLFKAMKNISGRDSYIMLDDLYHIRKEDQHLVIDFLHSIAKQNGVVLKIGTIRHRSQWYLHGNPPKGLKIGDDCDEINLDLSLEDFEAAKVFLSKVLNQIVQDTLSCNLNDIVTDGCIERLVLASGGVARDFLGIFKKAIEITRSKEKSTIRLELALRR